MKLKFLCCQIFLVLMSRWLISRFSLRRTRKVLKSYRSKWTRKIFIGKSLGYRILSKKDLVSTKVSDLVSKKFWNQYWKFSHIVLNLSDHTFVNCKLPIIFWKNIQFLQAASQFRLQGWKMNFQVGRCQMLLFKWTI